MNSILQQLINLLSDNDYKPKYRDIPDEVDNKDEIIAEYQEILDDDGLLPDSLRFFELNGISDSKELTSFLKKSFQQFKNEFFAGKHSDNELYKSELLQQLDVMKKDIELAYHESNQLNDDSLSQMFETKLRICDELSEFITSTQSSNQKTPKIEPQERHSYNWLKGEELLTDFYNKMKSNELIAKDTDITDFKAIFSFIPVSDIKKPVQWEKGAKLFAYFFHKLITNNYIPQKPSWINLSHCFTYNRTDIGGYVAIEKGIKSHVTVISNEGTPKGAELVDVLFE